VQLTELLLPAAILACGCTPAEPRALLGAGEFEWEELEPGDEHEIIQGPQGGFHLLASVRVGGVEPGDPDDLEDPNNPTVRFDVLVDGASRSATGEFTQGLESTPPDASTWTHQVVGRFAILDITDDDELHGETAELTVEVRDVAGLVVTDALELELVRHPLNP
jgi:hypothetical protein